MNDVSHKCVGCNTARLLPERGNPLEVAFHNKWMDLHTTCDFLSGILSVVATKRDHEVAATVVQWLGTPVRLMFARQVISEAGYE